MMGPSLKARRAGVPRGGIPHKKRQTHTHDLGILFAPAPAEEGKYRVLRTERHVRPLKGRGIPAEMKNLSFDIGREPDAVSMPMSFYPKEGPMQSKVHGTLSMDVEHDQHGAWVKNIRYSDIGRGTAVFELPKKLRNPRQILGAIKDAKPHETAPHMQLGANGEGGILRVKPNRTVLVLGVHPDTIQNGNLRIGKYRDIQGTVRDGFVDEYGNVYPWVVVTAPRRPDAEK